MDAMSNNISSVHLIELRGASKIYRSADGGFPALDRIDLRLAAGECIAVVGRSGSGKSTLINLIAGIDRPTSGEVHVGGTPVHALDESRLAAWRGRSVGVVFQSFQLLPTLTAAENVMLPMDYCATLPRAQARRRALALLEQVGIADQANKLPSMLSGGQQQRAAIARALANDPALVVADEPTGNLDTATTETVLALLRGLTRAGKTVLMVTHERDMSRLADRVLTLADGKLVSDVRGEAGRRTSPAEASHA
jgi:putative ABC transport system ATP-binding protein